MSSAYVETAEMGRLRFGMRYPAGGARSITWFRWTESGQILFPHNKSGKLEKPSDGTRLVIEAEHPVPDDKLYVFFGGQLDESSLESEYIVELFPEPDKYWVSVERRDSSGQFVNDNSFGSFQASYWSVAETQLSLLRGSGEPITRLNGNVVAGTLKIEYDEWRRQVYDRIIEQSSLRQQADVTAPIKGIASLIDRSKSALEKSKGSRALELYLRVHPLLDEFESTTRSIIKRPASKLEREIEYADLSDDELVPYFERVRSQSIHRVDRTTLVQNRSVPAAFAATHTKETFDISENRFLQQVIQKVVEYLSEVADEMDRYIEARSRLRRRFEERRLGLQYKNDYHWQDVNRDVIRHKKARNALVGIRHELRRFEHNLRCQYGVEVEAPVHPESEIFYYDKRYARLRMLYRKIESSLSSDVISEETVPFRTQAFNRLYQRWCFDRVVWALQQHPLGFEIDNKKRKSVLYKRPPEDECYCTMSHSEYPGLEIQVWYERRYNFYSNRKRMSAYYGYMDDDTKLTKTDENWTHNYRHRPDIVLECWHPDYKQGKYPLIVTLDPTISRGKSKRSLRKKYDYAENIRCFNPREENDDGIALPLVQAAWALYPGGSENDAPRTTEGSYSETYARGFAVLHPGNEEQFVDTLDAIISKQVLSKISR